jgi:hypothetical protein
MKTAAEYIKYLAKFGYTVTKEPFKYKILKDFDGYTSFFEFNEEDIIEEESFDQICLVNQNEEVLFLTCDSLITVIEDGKLNIDKMLDNAIVEKIDIETKLCFRWNWISLFDNNSQYYMNDLYNQFALACNKIIQPNLSNLEYVLTHILPNINSYKNEYIAKSLFHRNYIIKEFTPLLEGADYKQVYDFLIDSTEINDDDYDGKRDISLGYVYHKPGHTINLCTDFITQKLMVVSNDFVYKGDVIDNKFNIEESIEFDKFKNK